MLAGIGKECIITGQKGLITTSTGASIFPDHGRDGEALTRHADQAVYHAKQSGRNSHVVFRDEPAA